MPYAPYAVISLRVGQARFIASSYVAGVSTVSQLGRLTDRATLS
jgi:hypothetical protein